jgi:long-chain acyl-CoA synthetase
MDQLRIFDIIYLQKQKFPKPDALASKVNGEWKLISTDEFINTAEKVACGFMAMGLAKGDIIATICTNNRYEWNFIDLAVSQLGIIHVPIYPTISDGDYKFIFNNAEVKYVFVSDEGLYKRVKAIMSECPSVKSIYTFNEVAGANSWKEILQAGEKNFNKDKLEEIKKTIKPLDLATMIYTSGTTGTPKGVMLSHNNITSNVIAAEDLIPVDYSGRALSFLPLCHVYERMLNYLYQYMGISIYYAESIDTIGDNLKEVKPHIFVAVPRVIEKIYDKILAAGNQLRGIKKKLFFWSIDLGSKYELDHANGFLYDLKLSIARKLVFSKWKAAVGGNLKTVVSGSAPIQPRLIRIFWAAGIPLLEGYGLTESSPVISVNTLKPGGAHFGTVGPMLKDVQVKIAEDGEILCKGPNVMMGYYKRPDLTAETITDGWLHTGDIGTIIDGKFLKITDRKKELLKTSGGKYIAPQPIENKMKESPFIEQIMVIGDGQKFAAALIVPKFHFIEAWCKEKGITFSSRNELIQNKAVLDLYRTEIDKYNVNFGHIEQIKRFELVTDEWSTGSGELTPTLKLKRKIIMEKYASLIQKIYHSNGDTVGV